MNDISKQLQNVVMCSETMLKIAVAGDWKKVIDIEAQRSVLLDKLFSRSDAANNTADMDEKIRKIISINKKLEEITINAREATRKDIASICKGRNALNQYSKNTI